MTIFSLFAAFMGTFAWFNSVKVMNQSATGFQIQYDDSSITASSVYCIKYDGIYGASATKLTEGSDGFVMSEYDSIFKDKNVNTPLFLRIEILDYDRAKSLTISVPSSGAYKTGNNAYVNNFLSNVVCTKFSFGLGTGGATRDNYNLTNNSYLGGDIVTIYEGMRDNAKDIVGVPFVTNTSTGAKNSTVTHTITKNTIPSAYITDGKVVVFLEFDYYVDEPNSINLVDSYIRSYDGTGYLPDRQFVSDIGIISLRDTN